jgi:hypothetical protein
MEIYIIEFSEAKPGNAENKGPLPKKKGKELKVLDAKDGQNLCKNI